MSECLTCSSASRGAFVPVGVRRLDDIGVCVACLDHDLGGAWGRQCAGVGQSLWPELDGLFVHFTRPSTTSFIRTVLSISDTHLVGAPGVLIVVPFLLNDLLGQLVFSLLSSVVDSGV